MTLWLSLLIGCAWLDAKDAAAFYDQDGDGVPFPRDCDDSDPTILTGYTVFADADGDGWGDANQPDVACAATAGLALQPGDCDDADATAHPGATERCGGGDEDCDGFADDLDPDGVLDAPVWYVDADLDGYGAGVGVSSCAEISGRSQDATDCNDADDSVHPGAVETCGGVDSNCNFRVDDADPATTDRTVWFYDGDGDGFGDPATSKSLCTDPAHYVALGTDCDDTEASISPAATELCGGGDEDCDGLVDDDDPSVLGTTTWYADVDDDGFGDRDAPSLGCYPNGRVADSSDCDDVRADVNPASQEVCDATNTDEDCDGAAEDADSDVTGTQRYYVDGDGDKHGAPDAPERWCDPPPDVAAVGDDCDDLHADVFPGAAEVWYDGVDEDCNAKSDYDADADGHDTKAHGGDDCDDKVAATHPGAKEVWYDGVDSDCDGHSDADADFDGHDDAAHGGDDCDDAAPAVHPGVPEIWYDGVDQDCKGDDDYDADADGHRVLTHAGDDCDDKVASTYPGADEFIDGVDSNCDGKDAVCGSTIRRVPLDKATPQLAIAASCPGDTVRVSPGNWAGPFVVSQNITVEGTGPGVRFVGSGLGPVVTTSRATFRHLTITGGNATVFPGGGGMRVENATGARLEDLVITGNNSASWGGGVTIYNSAFVRIDHVTVENNTGGSGAGLMLSNGPDTTITNSTFRNNHGGGGAGLYVGGGDRLRIEDSSFTGNVTPNDGGGAYLSDLADGVVTRSTFDGNSAGNDGGMGVSTTARLTITDAEFNDNTTSSGSNGGLGMSYNDDCMLDGVDVHANNGPGMGFYQSTCTVRRSHIWDNTGVGLSPGYTPLGFLVEDTDIDTNTGGVSTDYGTIAVYRRVALRGNRSFAIWNNSPTTLEDVLVENTINTSLPAVIANNAVLRGVSVLGSSRAGLQLSGTIDGDGVIAAGNGGIGLSINGAGTAGHLDHIAVVGNGAEGIYSSVPATGVALSYVTSAYNLFGFRASAGNLALSYCHTFSNASGAAVGGLVVTGCGTADPKFQTFGNGLDPDLIDLHLRAGSPLRDAGAAAGDADGSKGDIGAYGGLLDTFGSVAWYADADKDTLPDGWEAAYALGATADDRTGDPDADGLTNLVEYTKGTVPSRADTDGDGIDDKTEITNGTDPDSPYSP